MKTVTANWMEVRPLAAGSMPANVKEKVNIGTLQVHKGDERPKGFGMFSILTQEDGDKRIIWDSNSLTEVREAKELFNGLIEKGFKPYRIDPKTGMPSEILMTEFDAMAEEVFMEECEIVMAPIQQAVGG